MSDQIAIKAYRLWTDDEDEHTIALELGVKVSDVADLVNAGRLLAPRKPRLLVYNPGMGYDTTKERDIDRED